MLRQVPLGIQDADIRRASKPSLRATLVAGLVVPADFHLLLDLALLSEHHEVGKAEDRAHAVQVARRRRLSEVLLGGPPARGVDDGTGSSELMEFLLRRTEIDQHHLSASVEDDVLG